MADRLLGQGHPAELTIRFAQPHLELKIPLLQAFQTFIQAPREGSSAAAEGPDLTAEFVEQIVAAGAAGGHEWKEIRLGDRHQAKSGIKAAANTLEGGQRPHHEDQLNRQTKGLAIDQVVEIAGEFVDHVGREGWGEGLLQHQPHETAHRTHINATGDHSGRLQLLHQCR